MHMSNYVVRLLHRPNVVQLTIPVAICRARSFSSLRYLVIDDSNPDYLILRRLIFDEKDNGSIQNPTSGQSG